MMSSHFLVLVLFIIMESMCKTRYKEEEKMMVSLDLFVEMFTFSLSHFILITILWIWSIVSCFMFFKMVGMLLICIDLTFPMINVCCENIKLT